MVRQSPPPKRLRASDTKSVPKSSRVSSPASKPTSRRQSTRHSSPIKRTRQYSSSSNSSSSNSSGSSSGYSHSSSSSSSDSTTGSSGSSDESSFQESSEDESVTSKTKKTTSTKTKRNNSLHRVDRTTASSSSSSSSSKPAANTKKSLFFPEQPLNHFLTPQQQSIAQYLLIRNMRLDPNGAATNAAVDTMGCSQVGDRSLAPNIFRWETLVSLMLSAQTKDEVTAAAIIQLRERLPNGLTVQSVLQNPDLAHDCIKKVGFHNTKIQSIIKAAQICQDQYNNDIPPDIDSLLRLPGVGPKMAHLAMNAAWNQISGIGVDVHVHRIANMLGWVSDGPTKNPEQTRQQLEKIVPKQYWAEINFLLVGFGQTVCPSIRPRCNDCLLAQNLLCQRSLVMQEQETQLQRDIEDLVIQPEKLKECLKVFDKHTNNNNNNNTIVTQQPQQQTVHSESQRKLAARNYILRQRLQQAGVTMKDISEFATNEPRHTNDS